VTGLAAVRVGMIGAGAVATRHVQTLLAMPGVRVAAVADPAVEGARRLAGRADAIPTPAISTCSSGSGWTPSTSLLGGQLGVVGARRLDDRLLRVLVVVFGVVIGVRLLLS
jgi:hypothetical protein